MGSFNSKIDKYGRNLCQETAFINYLTKFGQEFSANIEIPFEKCDPKGLIPMDKIEIHSTPESNVHIRVTQMGDFSFERVTKTLIMSACAYQGRSEIDNILDGYNCCLAIIVENTNNGALRLKFAQKPIQDEMFERELIPFPKPEKKREKINLYEEEKKSINSLTDVTPKKIYCWDGGLLKGILNGTVRFWNLIGIGAMIDRVSGHQSIWCQGFLWICSNAAWQQIEIKDDPVKLLIELHTVKESKKTSPFFKEISSWPRRKQVFYCVHPHEDVNYLNYQGKLEPRMLTYSYYYGKIIQKTYVNFYEFGLDEPLKSNNNPSTRKTVKLTINYHAQLHMFGFSRNFFLMVVTPLSVDKCGIVFRGTPILRSFNDSFQSNLTIYIVRRSDAPSWLPKLMIVDTKQQGNMYHTVNCFEECKYSELEINEYILKYRDELMKMTEQDPLKWNLTLRGLAKQFFPSKIVLDGWVSQLNAFREASQFALKQDVKYNVYDNQGSLYRFNMELDNATFKVTSCHNQVICPEIISSIDNHCINNYNYGRSYRYFWLVGYRKNRSVSVRNPLGDIEYSESILYGIKMPTSRAFPDPSDLYNVDAWFTKDHLPIYTSDKKLISYYMRTPIFVAKENISQLSGVQNSEAGAKEMKEKDGYLFVMVYRMVHEYREMKNNNKWESAAKFEEKEKELVHMISRMGDSVLVDENLLRPFAGGTDVKFTQPKFGLKKLESEEIGFISDRSSMSGAILLIFDALTFNSKSKPWIIEFEENVIIPYSIHSYSHQFDFKKLTEKEKKEADEERGKMMKKGEERFMDIYQSVILESNHSKMEEYILIKKKFIF